MNIELKQAAQDAVEAIDWLLKNIRLDAPQLSGKAMGNAEKCASALRAALAQQPAIASACGIPGMAKTTCPYCEQGFAFEHEQPATGEPVASRNPFASRCYTMSESHLSGHRLIVGFEKLGDVQDAHEWVARQGRGDYTHQAPSLPDAITPPTEEGTEYDYASGHAAKQDAAALNWIERQYLEELGMGLVIDAPNDGQYYVCGDSGTTHYGKTLREALAGAIAEGA